MNIQGEGLLYTTEVTVGLIDRDEYEVGTNLMIYLASVDSIHVLQVGGSSRCSRT